MEVSQQKLNIDGKPASKVACHALWLTDWLDNPYKDLLVRHLQPHGAEVSVQFYKLFFLPQILAAKPVDAVHFHVLAPFLRARNAPRQWLKLLFFVAQLWVLKVFGIRSLWTVHEWQTKDPEIAYELPMNTTPVALRFLDGLIVHCESTRQEIVRSVGSHLQPKIRVIPHGHYIDAYANTVSPDIARKQLAIAPRQTCFLLLGGIYRYKGVLAAIAAFQRLPGADRCLVIAGQISDRALGAEIEQAIQGQANIQYIPGRIAETEMQVYLNASDYVVLPYQIFTTSGVALLAMSFGKACIAPNSGFFRDVLDDSGSFLYEADRPEGLTEAMAKALQVGQTRSQAMGQHNRTIAQQWDWATIAQATYACYQGRFHKD